MLLVLWRDDKSGEEHGVALPLEGLVKSLDGFREMKRASEKIACLTAYDASFARVLEAAGIDMILVGDSLGMVVQGHATTVPVTMAEMVYHCRCVTRAVSQALVMADMPYMSCAPLPKALDNAARLMQEGGVAGVKLESGPRQFEVVHELSACGVPVCAHLGLRPQWVHKLGGFKKQACDAAAAKALLAEAERMEEQGADMLLLECVPPEVAEQLSSVLGIPVIGIGSGPACDGQILVLYDILGLNGQPSFAPDFLAGESSIDGAVRAYVRAVKTGEFPVRQ